MYDNIHMLTEDQDRLPSESIVKIVSIIPVGSFSHIWLQSKIGGYDEATPICIVKVFDSEFIGHDGVTKYSSIGRVENRKGYFVNINRLAPATIKAISKLVKELDED